VTFRYTPFVGKPLPPSLELLFSPDDGENVFSVKRWNLPTSPTASQPGTKMAIGDILKNTGTRECGQF
jgi:hypothetical protein